MKYLCLYLGMQFKTNTIIILISLLIFSCQSELNINDNNNSFYDDISDITHLNNLVYTTNYDMSGNAGNQVDLMVFDFNEVDYFLQNKFDLP